jgi:hypothetical protein
MCFDDAQARERILLMRSERVLLERLYLISELDLKPPIVTILGMKVDQFKLPTRHSINCRRTGYQRRFEKSG